ncbi:hypothetical protein H6792_01910 [Candidatus Nomurabacteria bacterium]|nr:hypothetical protein [Candidatus Nomurabacteria bacterium]
MYRIIFKKVALTGKVTVLGQQNQVIAYAHQKLLKIKEKVIFYQDSSRSQEIGVINADKMIDYNVSYSLTGVDGSLQYQLRRKGRASIWKANYQILDANDQELYQIREKNPWAKVMDSIAREIPFVGIFTGYIFHVKYGLFDQSNQEVAEIVKQPGFFESSFNINTLGGSGILSVETLELIVMMLIRERARS